MTDISQYLPEQSKTVAAIFAKYKELGDTGHMSRTLPASLIGHACERYLWYVYRQCCKPDFDGQMHRLFETGELEEKRMTGNLRKIGCTVFDIDETTGKQFKVTAFGGHLKGYMDSCILDLPEAPKTWHVGEYKTHNAKSFRELKKKGVKESKPQHYAQVQIEMHLTGMERALYLARNKDTDDLHSERIRYDKAASMGLMERAQRVITSTNPPDRISNRRDYYQCGWCDARSICWGSESPEPAIPLPVLSCRQCCHATPVLDGVDAQWKCEKVGGKTIDYEDQGGVCQDHLILPGLIAFAEPTDYGVNTEGDDFIDFQSNFNPGAVSSWRHGAEGYNSTELTKLPASALTNGMMQVAKESFGATVADHQMDILDRYPEGDSRIVWKGDAESLVEIWAREYNGECLTALTPLTQSNLPERDVIELEGGRIAILWRDGTAEIRIGVE